MKRIIILPMSLIILFSCGGGSTGENSDFQIIESVDEDPFKDVSGNVKKSILKYSFPIDFIDLKKKISFYLNSANKKLYFNDEIAEKFNMSRSQKSDYLSKIFDEIIKGEDLVEYIENNIAPKDSTISPTIIDTNQTIALMP